MEGRSFNPFGRLPVRSIPFSFMTSMTNGSIWEDGLDPALYTFSRSCPKALANPSAIWLRLAFSTQTNNTFIFSFMDLWIPYSLLRLARDMTYSGRRLH